MFTYEFWLSEKTTFEACFADPDAGELALALCLRGIAHIGQQTIFQCPDHKDEVMVGIMVCYDIARDRMGGPWLMARSQILATHGGPTPT